MAAPAMKARQEGSGRREGKGALRPPQDQRVAPRPFVSIRAQESGQACEESKG